MSRKWPVLVGGNRIQVEIDMKLDQAKLAGVSAFGAGRPSAPALNQKFLVEVCGQTETGTADLLAAYTTGWTIAKLAENAIDPEMPSIKELNRIKLSAASLRLAD
jgi:hypothetical protein